MARITRIPFCHPERPHRCNGLCDRCYWRAYYKKRPLRDRARFLKKTYKITLEEYAILFEKQNGVCGICGNKSKQNLHVDHNHITDSIRGLLCSECNLALGKLRVDHQPDILKKVEVYLNGKG
jgi:hypothetical protein